MSLKIPKNIKDLNLYHLLDIANFSSLWKIKRGYRDLALNYHPDRLPGDAEASQRFMLGTEAYRILIDEESRQNYDLLLKEQKSPISKKWLHRKKKSIKSFYTLKQKTVSGHEIFKREGQTCLAEFLKAAPKRKFRPTVYSQKTMGNADFRDFVTECRDNFQDFLKEVPRVNKNYFRASLK